MDSRQTTDGPEQGRPSHVAFGVTGGIGAYKAALIVRGFVSAGVRVTVIMTRNAARFITPALTTVQVPTFGLGWSAAELLIRIIEQDTPNKTQVLLDTELVIRESCGAATIN